MQRGRRRHQAAVGGEEVQLEVVERHLRQVVEVGGQLTGLRVGMNEPTSLALMPKPEATMKRRYWLPGLRFADVDGAVQRSVSAGVPIAKVPIFELSGQCGRALGAEVGLRRRCRRSGRRRRRG